ncbi:unnamed protein product [Caenorhabditis angaria]|uniref:Uncharacterized protein n=1 Tax=Caenorhabditis angaria TaxID=860376 RepID=A0A9P1IUE9_9PELO|nr:unnamed protein product [Caenorhabditis angaria]
MVQHSNILPLNVKLQRTYVKLKIKHIDYIFKVTKDTHDTLNILQIQIPNHKMCTILESLNMKLTPIIFRKTSGKEKI